MEGAAVYNSQGRLDQPNLILFTCSYCQLILRESQQVFSCGHRYCKVCIDQLTNESEGSYVCSKDKKEISQRCVRDDKACLKEIKCLSVDCPHRSNGCTWNGLLLDMEEHVGVCPQRILLCTQGCGQKISKGDIDLHTSSHCPKRLNPCQFCKKEIPWDSMEDHYLSCQEYPVKCEFCGKALPTRKELAAHFRECVEYSMQCPYEDCQFKGKRNALNQHLFTFHLIQMVEDTHDVHKELRTVKSENQELLSEISHLKTCKELNEKEIERLRRVFQQLQEERAMAKAPQHQLTGREQDYCVGSMPSIQRPSSNQTSARSRATSPICKDAYTQPNRPDKQICQTQLQKLSENIQNSLTQYAIAIDEVRLRQDVIDAKTVDDSGKFIWKIPDIGQRYQDAVDEKTVSLYSLPFYTSPNGYRVCIRIYLNGDGIGKSKHISVYFFIMRSEHDNLLSWPFKQSVRFTLINQKNPAASITEAFVPDLHSPSFKKPDYVMNIPSGFPKFAPQEVLQDKNYTTNSTLIIHCHIDSNGLALL